MCNATDTTKPTIKKPLPNQEETAGLCFEKLINELNNKDQIISQQQQEINSLKESIRLMLHKRFGKSSEKVEIGEDGRYQPDMFAELFNEIEQTTETDDASTVNAQLPYPDADTQDKPPKKRKGKKRLPEELPRVQVVIELPEEEQVCHQGHPLQVFDEIVSEELDIIPAKVQVIQTIRKKYVCKTCDESPIKTAPVPEKLLPKSLCSNTLLAFIITAKFCDGLPFYRQMAILKRYGIEALTRATLANWAIKASQKLTPLMNLLRDQLVEGPVIWMDETTLQVLKEPDKPPSSKSYMWVQVGGQAKQKVVLFHYSSSRAHEVPMQLLEDFEGGLQTDGYEAYETVSKLKGLPLAGCWDHSRRKFFDAKKSEPSKKPKNQSGSVSKSDVALSYIGKLYAIERAIKKQGLTAPEDIQAYRQREAKPVLEKFQAWLIAQQQKILPKSKLGKAIGYTLNQWPNLIAYCDNGNFGISNCLAENAIRPFVIGRKNWLFANTPRGADASAVYYSLIETAKANELEPYAYLRTVFEKLPAAQSLEDIEALLPWNIQLNPY